MLVLFLLSCFFFFLNMQAMNSDEPDNNSDTAESGLLAVVNKSRKPISLISVKNQIISDNPELGYCGCVGGNSEQFLFIFKNKNGSGRVTFTYEIKTGEIKRVVN
jgi:hypothetical protein